MSHYVNQDFETDFLSDIFSRVIRSPKLTDASGGRLKKDATHYRMDYGRRGLAAIFNQAGCEDESSVIENDFKALCSTFAKLSFEIETFNNLSFNEVECTLEDLSLRDHSDCDCLVLVYLTRGREGKLRARDKNFDVNCLWGCFTAEKSPTLANKPKVFIVHAYKESSTLGRKGRYESLREDCYFPGGHDGSGPDGLGSYYIPDRADFLITLSTVQGMVSLGKSNRTRGSLYIQTLCRQLDLSGLEQDMMTILTEVNRQILNLNLSVSTACNSCKRQLPTVISLLIRILKFTVKNSTSSTKRSKTACCSRGMLEEDVLEEAQECYDSQTVINKRKIINDSTTSSKKSHNNKFFGPKRQKRKKCFKYE